MFFLWFSFLNLTFFTEARIHGVGYYSFSTDETTRQKQMQDLQKQRQETLRAQKEAEEKKKKRDQLLEARVAAARARQRARAGLPPEEPKSKKKSLQEILFFHFPLCLHFLWQDDCL